MFYYSPYLFDLTPRNQLSLERHRFQSFFPKHELLYYQIVAALVLLVFEENRLHLVFDSEAILFHNPECRPFVE